MQTLLNHTPQLFSFTFFDIAVSFSFLSRVETLNHKINDITFVTHDARPYQAAILELGGEG